MISPVLPNVTICDGAMTVRLLAKPMHTVTGMAGMPTHVQ